MKKTLATALAAAGLLVGAATVDAAHGRGDLTVGLNGANEVGTAGDPNGSGKIHLDFFAAANGNPAYTCFDLTTRNVDEISGLHIHEVSGDVDNPRKDAGGVAVFLLGGGSTPFDDGNPDTTCSTMSSEALDGILEDPSEYYVNAHNAAYPAGAIRGQLHAFD